MLTKAGANSIKRIFKNSTSFNVYLSVIFLCTVIFNSTSAVAQKNNIIDTAYQKVIAGRTAKIINTLGIVDSTNYKKVHLQLIDQYLQLNAIHDNSKAANTSIKTSAISKEEMEEAIKNESTKKSILLKQLHQNFITQLSNLLTAEQIDKVKDGMTYSVLPVTWKAYMEMLLHLTQEQKDKMYAWLVEARELAMDEGSSDNKHAVFGKYKGKINNYLSAAGYNMKEEGEAWAKRIQIAKEAKQNQN